MKNKSIQILMKSKMILAAALLVAGISFSLNSAYAAETDEEITEETAEGEEGEESTDTLLTATPSYDIPDNASFVYEDVEYKPIDHYDPSRAPMNGEKITVNYKGNITPAYYWAPGDMVVFQVSLADEDIPKFEELSQEDQDTWKAFLTDPNKTAEEAYYEEMLPTYTFSFNFEENKIEPFVEFDFGKDGKVVMMPYDKENQGFYLEELSPSFLKLGNFEFATYQFLTINDDTCYHILSCMDQIGNVYLYQYDANGNSCARADVNMLIGLRYLAERTVALNEYIDKVQWYQDIVRKIIAGLVIAAVVAVFAVIFVKVGKRKNDDEDEDEEYEEDDEYEEELVEETEEIDETVEEIEELPEIDIEVPEEEEEDEILPEIQLEPEALLEEEDVEQEEVEEVEEETPDLSVDGFVPDFEDDVTEGGLFYAADTEEMKALFKEPVDEDEEEDDDEYEDEEDEDDFFEDEEDEEIEEVIEEETKDDIEEIEEEPSEPSVPEHAKKSLASIFDDDDEDEEEEEKPRRIRKEKKEKVKKEKKVKEKPKKRRKYEEDDEDEEEDSNDDDLEILDLNDL